MNTIHATYKLTPGTLLEIVQGDITQEAVDAIVNAANDHLQHGGGVAAAISKAGGPTIQQESSAYVREHGPVSNDQPAFTKAGRMPAKWVLHAVGPVWGEGDEDQKLATAIYSTLQLADKMQLKSIAFPAISTGIFGFPLQRATRIFIETFQKYFADQPASKLERVRMMLWDNKTLQAFLSEAHQQIGSKAL